MTRALTVLLVLAAALTLSPSGRAAESAGGRVDVLFDTAKGIVPGQVVKIAGARVGKVVEVVLTPEYEARLQLEVDPRFVPFREDASCEIQPEGLISENFVQCDPGSTEAPELRARGNQVPTVPLARTSVPVNLTDLFEIWEAPVRDRLRILLNTLGAGVAGQGEELNELLRRANPTLGLVDDAVGILNEQKGELQNAITQAKVVTGELARQPERLQAFVDEGADVLETTAARQAELRDGLRRLPPALAATRPALRSLESFSEQTAPVVRRLAAAGPELDGLLTQLPPAARAALPAVRALGATSTKARAAIAPARPVIRRLRRFAVAARPTVALTDRLLTDLRARGFAENFLSFAYYAAAATSRYDAISHIFPAHIVASDCATPATTTTPTCDANYTRSAPAATTARRKRPSRSAPPSARPASAAPGPAAPSAPTPVTPGTTPVPVPKLPDVPGVEVPTPVGPLLDFLLGKRLMRGSIAGGADNRTTLVGGILIIFALVATILSYSANRGLPFVPTYDVTVQVRDAAELVAGSSEVRIGGSRVGIVKEVRAVPQRPGVPAYAELDLGLDEAVGGLPVDTRAEVRPRSILGAKFVDLTRGRSARRVPADGTLPLSQSSAVVGLDEAFKVFEPRTRRVLQQSVVSIGDGLAGRGSALNETIGEINGLIAPLQRTLVTLTADRTRLGPLIAAADRATAVLAPVAPELEALVDDGATTLAALDAARPELDRAIADTPATLVDGTRAALAARPVLDDTTRLMRGLRPATEELPRAAVALRRALVVGTPVLARVPTLTRRLDPAVTVLRRLVQAPVTTSAVQRLREATRSAQGGLDVIAPAQFTCNVIPVFFRNIASVVSEGDAQGSWFDTTLNVDLTTAGRRATTPSPTLHANPLPTNDATQCETGNEPYAPGQRIGSPGGAQPQRTEETSAPAEATERGRAAGLVGER